MTTTRPVMDVPLRRRLQPRPGDVYLPLRHIATHQALGCTGRRVQNTAIGRPTKSACALQVHGKCEAAHERRTQDD